MHMTEVIYFVLDLTLSVLWCLEMVIIDIIGIILLFFDLVLLDLIEGIEVVIRRSIVL